MDILTPKGQQSQRHAERAIYIYERSFPDRDVRMTDPESPADIDVLIFKGRLFGIAEIKCRDMTLRQLEGQFENRWLITNDKLTRARAVADALQAHLFGFLYLIPDDLLLVQPIYAASNGKLLTDVTVKRTLTAETVNGGGAVRDNAFIDVTFARRLYGNDAQDPDRQ